MSIYALWCAYNACIYHFGASVIHGQRSNILRLPIINFPLIFLSYLNNSIILSKFKNFKKIIHKKDLEALISQSFKVSFYAWTLSRFRMNYINFFTFCELFRINCSLLGAI